MATHSNILVWRIPLTEEPGGLESMGSQSQTRLSIYIYICDSSTYTLRDSEWSAGSGMLEDTQLPSLVIPGNWLMETDKSSVTLSSFQFSCFPNPKVITSARISAL